MTIWSSQVQTKKSAICQENIISIYTGYTINNEQKKWNKEQWIEQWLTWEGQKMCTILRIIEINEIPIYKEYPWQN